MNNVIRKSTLVLSKMDKASMTMLKRLKEIEDFDNIGESEEYIKLQSENRTLIVLNEEMIYYNNIEEIENSDRFVFWFQTSEQNVQQGGFSRTISPQNTRDFTTLRLQIHTSQNGFVVKGKFYVVDFKNQWKKMM